MNLTIENIYAGYGEKNVLTDVSFQAVSGKVTGIVGPNGVGKTTLLKCIAGLEKAKKGQVLLEEKNLLKIDRRELAQIQAYVPQKSGLLFPMTAEEFVTLGRRPYVSWNLKETDRAVIKETFRYLHIEHLKDCYVDEISGGEYQKVMLARALVQEPQILLLDEPTSALDIRHQIDVMEVLRKIAREKQCIVLLVMHDLSLVSRFTDQAAFLWNGKLEDFGNTAEVMTEKLVEKVFQIPVKILSTEYGRVVVPLEEAGSCITV